MDTPGRGLHPRHVDVIDKCGVWRGERVVACSRWLPGECGKGRERGVNVRREIADM